MHLKKIVVHYMTRSAVYKGKSLLKQVKFRCDLALTDQIMYKMNRRSRQVWLYKGTI